MFTDSILVDSLDTDTMVTDSIVTDTNATDSTVKDTMVTDSIVTNAMITNSIVTDTMVTDSFVGDTMVTKQLVTDSLLAEKHIPESSMLTKNIKTKITRQCELVGDGKVELHDKLGGSDVKPLYSIETANLVALEDMIIKGEDISVFDEEMTVTESEELVPFCNTSDEVLYELQ